MSTDEFFKLIDVLQEIPSSIIDDMSRERRQDFIKIGTEIYGRYLSDVFRSMFHANRHKWIKILIQLKNEEITPKGYNKLCLEFFKKIDTTGMFEEYLWDSEHGWDAGINLFFSSNLYIKQVEHYINEYDEEKANGPYITDNSFITL